MFLFLLLFAFFLSQGYIGFPLCPKISLHYDTKILQRIAIIVGDAGIESGTSAPEVWCATFIVISA